VTLPDSIEPDQLKVAAIVVIVVLAVLALVIMRIVQKMVLRVVMAGVLVAAGAFVYAQRDDLDDCQKRVRAEITSTEADVKCICTVAGVEVTVPRCPVTARSPDG
jgi:hypothetical protein